MKKIIYILLLFITHCTLVIVNCYAQVSQQWVARYHFYSEDYANDIALDDSGNVYVTGESDSPGALNSDYGTVKYNSSGVQQWVQRYDGPGNANRDQARSIAVDGLGNVYVTGLSNRAGFPLLDNYDFATIKYNTNGVQQWVRRYGGNGQDGAIAISLDAAGNIYVGGTSAESDYAVVKYNPNGDSLWVKLYNSGGGYDYAEAMAVDLNGNVYLTGSVGINIPEPDWVTVKWNSQGVFQWAQRYNGPGNAVDYPKAIAVSDSGNVYVTGYVWGNNNNDYATIKYNSSGIQQWVAFYNGGLHDTPSSVTCDDSGNVYVTGGSDGISRDYLTIKYNSSGVQQWTARFNGPGNGNDIPCCIKLDTHGNVYVTGYATVATNNSDYCTIKYSNSGVQQWVIYYSAASNSGEQANALAIDTLGNVYITGLSVIGNSDYATVKYSQTTGIIQISGEIPKEYKLEQNYPNPFNPTTHFEFRIADFGLVNLIVYDVLGKEIQTLVNEELKPGIYKAEWNAGRFTSGVYFYRLITNGFIETKKMILNK